MSPNGEPSFAASGAGEKRSTKAASLRPATIRDVSKLANVSRMTVTRVLSAPDLVKADTRARVMTAIAHLGYVPNRAAGSLSNRRSGFVGLVLPTLTNVNFSTVAHGLSDTIRARGFHLLIAYNDYSLVEEEAQIRDLIARRPEAIVLSGTVHSREAKSLLMRADIPIIEIADIDQRPIQHAVGFSNHEAGRMAARHLLSCGFTRVGAIGSLPAEDRADHRGEARLRGFEQELRLHGVTTDYVLREGGAPVSYEHGAGAIGTLLSRHPDIQAVFCISDLSAVGVVMECQRRGLVVPEGLAVMGFGDFDIGRVLNPPLTTIRVDFRTLGARAGALILDLLDGKGEAPEMISVDLEVIERGSVTHG